jgi:hypothetical protein
MALVEDLPADWEFRADEASVWRYNHRYLDIEVAVTDDYGVAVRRASAADGIVEDDFAPDGPIDDRTDARDWARALMAQIDREFAPATTDYAAGAMRTLGDARVAAAGSAADVDVTTCPICDAPLFQYRGTSVAEQAHSHVEFMNDDPHAELAADIEERVTPSEDGAPPDSGAAGPGVGPARGASGSGPGSGPRSGSGGDGEGSADG